MNQKRKKKTKKNTINVISKSMFIIFFMISSMLVIIGISLNVLPNKYLIPLMLFYLFILVLNGFLVWTRNTKNWLKIIAIFVCLLGTIVSSFGLYYLNSTLNLMSKIQTKGYQLEDYYILVNKDSNYHTIGDLKGRELITYKNALENYQKSQQEIKSKVEVTTTEYDSFMEAAKDLLENKVDAVLISAVNKAMVEEELEDFEKNTRIIYTASLKIENETVVKEANVAEESFNVYISGIDIYGNITSVSRSDVNIVATINPNTHKVLLTSIPRDYYVQLHGTKGYKDKLTHAGIYGIDKSVQTIEDLLDIDINYYVRVNFTTLINLVDAIGGIDVYSDYDLKSNSSNDTFKKGWNHLNGKQALAFSRERKAFADGDRQRGKNQQKVLTAIMNKVLSTETLIKNYTNILESLGNSFQTNMDSKKIYELVNMQLAEMPSWTIESISLNGMDSHNYTYSYPGMKLYVMEPDINTVNEAKLKINQIEEEK